MNSVLKKNMIFNSVLMLRLGVLSLLFMIYVVLYFMIGIITTCVNVPLSSYFQVQVPIEYQGRFLALLTVASGLLIPLGMRTFILNGDARNTNNLWGKYSGDVV